MALSFDVSSSSHASGSSSTSQASFTWNHVGNSFTTGVVVFVISIAATDNGSSVTYGGVAMTAIPYTASDTDTELGTIKAYYLSSCGTGTKAVVVSRTNNATAMIAFAQSVQSTISSTTPTEVYLPGVITQGGSSQNTAATTSGTGTGASGELSVTDGLAAPPESVRIACRYTGAAAPILAGTNSILDKSNDLGQFGASCVHETSSGNGSRSIGFATGTTDDRATIYFAVRETPASATTNRQFAQAQADIKATSTQFAQTQTFIAYTNVHDTFTRSVSDDWGDADVGGTYTIVQGAAADYDVTGTEGTISPVNNSGHRISLHQVAILQSATRFKFKLDRVPTLDNIQISFNTHRIDSSNDYEPYLLIHPDLTVTLAADKHVASVGSGIGGSVSSGLTFAANTYYWFYAEVVRENSTTTRIRSRVWQDGSTEPGTFTYNQVDTEATLQTVKKGWQLHVFAYSGSEPTTLGTFDNIDVDTFIPTAQGQAQADIKALGQQFAQAQADIKAKGTQFAQANADIKATSRAFAQAQADIKTTNRFHAQALATIRGNAFGQTQADIKTQGYGLGQAQGDIKATNFQFGQAQATIRGNQFGQAQTDIKAIGYQFGQAQAKIVLSSTSTNQFAQAQADIKRTNFQFAQAQADIKSTGYQFGQAQADIKRTQFNFAQAQADIKATSTQFGQAQGDIKAVGYQLGQAQADVKATSYQFGQANAHIMRLVANDNFTRTVGAGSWGTSSDGRFTWGGFPDLTSISVDGAAGKVVAGDTVNLKDYPTILKGIVQFDFKTAATNIQATPTINFDTRYENISVFGTVISTVDKVVVQTFNGGEATLTATLDTWYTVKVYVGSVDGDIVRLKIWKQGDPEPAWMASSTTSTTVVNGFGTFGYGLRISTRAGSDYEASFDNLYIYTTTPDLQFQPWAQASADIKATNNQFAQAQATIRGNVFAQAQADIKATSNQFGQAQADVKATGFQFGQAQADIKTTNRFHAQAQTDIKQVGYGSGQAQADIKTNGFGSGQSQADIKTTYYQFGQSNADIKSVGYGFGQANSDIKATGYQFGQSQADIKTTYYQFGQANADIKRTQFNFAQAQATIQGNQFGQAQGDIRQTYYQSAQSQADIKATYYQFGQAQAKMNAFGQCQFGQAQGNIKFEGTSASGQAQAKINAFNQTTYGQAQADIKATGRNYVQTQADIKQTYTQSAQAQATIRGNQFGQSQADIKATSTQYGQAQATIQGNQFGQSQADIKQVGYGSGQAQSDIKQTYYQFGQTQADIKTLYFASAQTNADIKAIGYGFGQCQADIKSVGYGFGQCQASIQTGRTQSGQCQADIKSIGYGSGQCQADIRVTSYIFGQCQADIRRTEYRHAQAQAQLVTTYNQFAQAQGTIKAVSASCGQAQASIKATYNSFGQAQSDIRAQYTFSGQANALIGTRVSVSAQAQADILATSSKSAQANSDILATLNKFAQAQAWITARVNAFGQAQGQIKLINYQTSQAQAAIQNGFMQSGQAQGTIVLIDQTQFGQALAFILKAAGYGQAQALIFQSHTLKKLRATDRASLRLSLSDKESEELENNGECNLILCDRPPLQLIPADRQKRGGI